MQGQASFDEPNGCPGLIGCCVGNTTGSETALKIVLGDFFNEPAFCDQCQNGALDYSMKGTTIFGKETLPHWRAERDFTLEAIVDHRLDPGELVAFVFSFLWEDEGLSSEKLERLQ